jgi:hypothetical protein
VLAASAGMATLGSNDKQRQKTITALRVRFTFGFIVHSPFSTRPDSLLYNSDYVLNVRITPFFEIEIRAYYFITLIWKNQPVFKLSRTV